MMLPAIAARTLKMAKDHPILQLLYHQTRQNLSKLFNPIARARFVHSQIDNEIQTLFKDEAVQKHVSCKKGCSACCHTQVSISHDEAKLLSQKILNSDVEIDLKKLVIQANAKDDAAKWYKLSYEDRGCVFLDNNGECQVYADRPAVCRTNYVTSSAEFCETKNGQESPVRLLNTHKADLIVAAAFHAALGGGALPYQIFQQINKKNPRLKKKDRPEV